MNKLEAASNLKMILDEVTETEEAICYVTSNDAETLKLAIEAIEQWNLVDQYKWERDVVLEQLKEIGCVFGQNMEKPKEAIDWLNAQENSQEQETHEEVTQEGDISNE